MLDDLTEENAMLKAMLRRLYRYVTASSTRMPSYDELEAIRLRLGWRCNPEAAQRGIERFAETLTVEADE